jgi:tRNA-Thr(GGU) m(6)t(6)A37 methyltransferase TsaA
MEEWIMNPIQNGIAAMSCDCGEKEDENPEAGVPAINLSPIGQVECEVKVTAAKMVSGWPARIRVWPEFEEALLRITEHSHLWVLCWFHESRRDLLKVRPSRMDASLPEYGVFSLRCPARPNPISLTAVKLEKVEGNILHVTGLDAIHGTYVLDIKPYFGSDIIFSSRAPYLRPADREMRQDMLAKMALAHHGEECADLQLGVRMALLAEEFCGPVQDNDLQLVFKGPACLADVLQGITRARLANPARFTYLGHNGVIESIWTDKVKIVRIIVKENINRKRIYSLTDEELFQVIVC